jgi:hypothetical protein
MVDQDHRAIDGLGTNGWAERRHAQRNEKTNEQDQSAHDGYLMLGIG